MPTPASTGTVTIDGTEYTWMSPTLADLEHFEATVGPLIGSRAVVDTIKGRIALISLVLVKHHPDLLPGVVRTWGVDALVAGWDAVLTAIPLWGSPTPPSSPSPSLSAGPPPSSEPSESAI